MMKGEKRKSLVGVINRVGVVGLSGRRNTVAREEGERKTGGRVEKGESSGGIINRRGDVGGMWKLKLVTKDMH